MRFTAGHSFWSNLARESQQEFKRSSAEGKCIEARELIIALPEAYTQYEPQRVLEDFTEEFRRRYDVECVSALHHNKRKTNYHIHLIFSERRLLAEPEVKIAARSVFFDETGKRVRTKKEITGADGQIRKGCTVIPKGGVYEQHLFTVKDGRFKSEPFLEEVKRNYTALINRHIADPEQHLRVFNPDSIYLPTKKIGKNNPKAAEMEADNAARQEWNRTADMALLSGIEEAKILEIKRTEIHEKPSQSIKSQGWLPNLFRSIVNKANHGTSSPSSRTKHTALVCVSVASTPGTPAALLTMGAGACSVAVTLKRPAALTVFASSRAERSTTAT